MAYEWPGNIRELENTIERAFVLCNKGLIEISHLSDDIKMGNTKQGESKKISEARDMMEYQTILNALKRNNFNRAAAAAEIGIHKTTFYRKIKKLGIELPSEDGRTIDHSP